MMKRFCFIVINILFINEAQSLEPGTELPFSCTVEYRNSEWGEPTLNMNTMGNLSYSCSGIQFSQIVYDSFRCYLGFDGKNRIFQAAYKVERINYGAPIMNMPLIPRETLFSCLKLFTGARDNGYLPDPARNQSIHMRAYLVSTTKSLRLVAAREVTMAVTGTITNDRYDYTKESVRVRVETKRRRNYEGSMIYIKTPSNYGPAFESTQKTRDMGYDISLWLYKAKSKKECIAELTMANVFFVMKDQNEPNKRVLLTIRDKYIIFPGSFRNATITMLPLFNDLSFEKKCVQICNLEKLVNQGILLEMFATSHNFEVVAITEVNYKGKEIKIPTLQQPNPVFRQLKNIFYDYFYGINRSGYYSKFMYCESNETLQNCRD